MAMMPHSLAPTQGPAKMLRELLAQAAQGSRRGLRRADPALHIAARLAEPAALGTIVVTGLALPWLEGDWAPVPACRALHVSAGLVLLLVLAYRVVAGTSAAVATLWKTRGSPGMLTALLRLRGGWRGAAVQGAYTVALLAMLLTGVEHAWALRGVADAAGGAPTRDAGATLLGLLSPSQALALHSLGAPYFYGALLLLSYVKGRQRARALVAELRAP